MKKVYIYALVDPVSEDVRYIGKTVNPDRRLICHKSECKTKHSYRANWINSLVAKGLSPVMKVIDMVSGEGWEESERYWIRYYKNAGCRLTNGTPGGEGGDTWTGKHHTAEQIEKIRNANIDKFVSQETRQRQSIARKGNKWDLGRVQSEDTKEKIRVKLRGAVIPETIKNKISETLIGRVFTEAHREKLRVAALNREERHRQERMAQL